MADLLGHALDIAADGTCTTTHPEDDVERCEFNAYVQSDWENSHPMFRPSRWSFIRRTAENGTVDWLGSRLDDPGAPS